MNKKVYVDHILTDMGNGVALCSNCSHDLNHGDVFVKIPDECPNCKSKFSDHRISEYNFGGSDY